jgi:copper homeostasis protein
MLEVIAETVCDAIAAEAGGADRIELVAALSEGGLTPSLGVAERVLQAVAIPVHVMIRPHSRSFVYDLNELLAMRRDIEALREAGAQGFVLGPLNIEGLIDKNALRLLLEVSGEAPVTFHRAFDELPNLEAGLAELTEFKSVNRVLTSGGKPDVKKALREVKRLQGTAESLGIAIMPGGGLRVESIIPFVRETGVTEIHMGAGVRAANRRGYVSVSASMVARAKENLIAAKTAVKP